MVGLDSILINAQTRQVKQESLRLCETIYADASVDLGRNGGSFGGTAKLFAEFCDLWIVVRLALQQHEPLHWSELGRRLRQPRILGMLFLSEAHNGPVRVRQEVQSHC